MPRTAAVYACGPPAMLEAVRRICVERSVPAELAMEAAMACGFGACFGCVVRTPRRLQRLCVDGPVVAAAELDEALERRGRALTRPGPRASSSPACGSRTRC